MPAPKLTPLGVALLQLLHEKPMHPYEMAQLMRDRYVDRRVKLKAGSLYHTVERLQHNGFIEIIDTQRDGRRPERTVYAMTQAGQDVLQQRGRELLGDIAEEYPAVLTGLALVDELGKEAALAELEHRLIRLRAAIAADEVMLEQVRGEGVPEVYWLDFRYAADHRLFELEWCERLYADLEDGRISFQGPQPVMRLVDDERKTS